MVSFISESHITSEMLRASFTRIAQRHPMMRTRFRRSHRGDLYFEMLDDVIVNLEERTESDWVSVWEENVTANLGHDDQPLWFVQHLPEAEPDYTTDQYRHQCTFLLTHHHASWDAMTTTCIILNELLNELESAIKGEVKSDNIISLPFPPPLETVVRNYLSISDQILMQILTFCSKYCPNLFIKMAKLGQRSLFRRHSSVQALLQREQKAITCKPTSSVVPVSFSKEQTKALFTKCKKHKVSPFAALAASYFVCLDKHATIRNKDVSFAVTSNLRKYGEEKYPDINNYCSVNIALTPMQMKMPSANKSLWDVANEYQRVIHSDLKEKAIKGVTRVEVLNMLNKSDRQSVRDRSFFLGSFHNGGKVDVLNRSDASPIRLAACHASMSDYKLPAFLVSIFCITFEGELSFTLQYGTNVLTKEFARELSADIKTTLLDNC